MSKEREELIEVMARAICREYGDPGDYWIAYADLAQAALSAIEGDGKVVLSRTLTTAQLQAAQDFEVSLSWEQAQDLFDAMINAYSPKPSGDKS